MNEYFARFARKANTFCASPFATALVFASIAIWAGSGPHFRFSDTWQLAMNTTSSIVTFLMVFLIANAQKRDTDALNLKLDMLVAADRRLSNKAVGLEAAPVDRTEEVRRELERVIDATEKVVQQAQGEEERSARRRP